MDIYERDIPVRLRQFTETLNIEKRPTFTIHYLTDKLKFLAVKERTLWFYFPYPKWLMDNFVESAIFIILAYFLNKYPIKWRHCDIKTSIYEI